MVALIALTMAALALLGLYLMNRLDSGLCAGRLFAPPSFPPVLLFGPEGEVEPLARALEEEGTDCVRIGRPALPPGPWRAVCALSYDDLENLTLCLEARRVCPSQELITRKNSEAFGAVYSAAHIEALPGGRITAQRIQACWNGTVGVPERRTAGPRGEG